MRILSADCRAGTYALTGQKTFVSCASEAETLYVAAVDGTHGQGLPALKLVRVDSDQQGSLQTADPELPLHGYYVIRYPYKCARVPHAEKSGRHSVVNFVLKAKVDCRPISRVWCFEWGYSCSAADYELFSKMAGASNLSLAQAFTSTSSPKCP
jgi:hypothetical protein